MMHFRRRIAENLGQAEPKAASGEFFSNIKSMLFDGVDERVVVPHSVSLDFERTDAFSISCWVRFSTLGTYNVIVAKAINGGTYRGYEFAKSQVDTLRFFLINTDSSNWIRIDTAAVLSVDTWYHVAVTYSGSSSASGVSIYLNGVLLTPTVVADTLTATIKNTVDLSIGSRGAGNPSNAYIDEVALYSTKLSALQVADIYGSGHPRDAEIYGDPASLVSWWQMGDDVVSFPTIPDVKLLNTGTATNMESGDMVSVVP